MFLYLPIEIQETIFTFLCPKDRMKMCLSLPKSTSYVDIKNIRSLEVAARYIERNRNSLILKEIRIPIELGNFLLTFYDDSFVKEIIKGIDVPINISVLKLISDIKNNSVSITEIYDIGFHNIFELIKYPIAQCTIVTFCNLIHNVSTNSLIQDIFSDQQKLCQHIFNILNYDNYDLFHSILNGEAPIVAQDYRNIAINYITSFPILNIFCRNCKKLNHVLIECNLSKEYIKKLQDFCENSFYIDSALHLSCIQANDTS